MKNKQLRMNKCYLAFHLVRDESIGRIKIFIKSLILIPLLYSCDYVSNLKRTGDIITKEFEWNGASDIEIFAPVRVIPVTSEECKIVITGMDFIVNDYELIQSEEKFIVEHKNINHIQESKIADLYLYAPKFNSFTANSPCKLYSVDTLYFDNLKIVINGRGVNTSGNLLLKGKNLNFYAFGSNKCKIKFSGEINSTLYYIQGATIIDALELSTKKTQIKHKSYADSYIFATELLDVNIFSSGNVYYKGNPELKVEVTENNLLNSTGKVIRLQ